MTQQQAQIIIKEERLIRTAWYPFKTQLCVLEENILGIRFNPENNKYETFSTSERGWPSGFVTFDSEEEAINGLVLDNYIEKYFNRQEKFDDFLDIGIAQKIIQDENLEVIWYDEPLKSLCAGIKHDKKGDKYTSFITDSNAKIIEWRNLEFDGDKYDDIFKEIFNYEDLALYALINRARMIKQDKISFG